MVSRWMDCARRAWSVGAKKQDMARPCRAHARGHNEKCGVRKEGQLLGLERLSRRGQRGCGLATTVIYGAEIFRVSLAAQLSVGMLSRAVPDVCNPCATSLLNAERRNPNLVMESHS